MPERFILLLRQHEDALTRAWVDEIYSDRRTELPALLSYRQLVEPLPELFDELARVLDGAATGSQIVEAARRLRSHTQVRFRHGCLIDEVARELMILHDALSELLWQESPGVVGGDTRELHDALRRARLFFDEMIAQAILVYAASLRPVVPTRGSVWPPGRRRKR